MAKWVGRRLLALAALAGVSGCDTFSNLGRYTGICVLDGTPTERVYGGVRRDLSMAQDGLSEAKQTNSEVGRAGDLVGCACCLLVDLPLSAVGDTLTLPLVLPYA